MRKLAPLLLMAAVLAAGCGNDGGDPLDEALSHVPKDAPLVITLSTDLDSEQYQASRDILQKFPFADQLNEEFENSLREEKLSYEDDVKPLLGNELVVAAPSVEAAEAGRFIGAWQVKDEGKLRDLVEKDEEMKEIGEAEGATLYESEDDDVTAIKDDVIVVADSREDVEAALKRSAGDESLSADLVDETLGDLPDDAILNVSGDLRALLAMPEAAPARKVKWVAALDSFALTASVHEGDISVDYAVRTDPEGLTDEDLPIAAGDESPELIVRRGEAASGLRDLTHLFRFGEGVGRAVDPSGFGDYQQQKAQLGRQLDVDLDRDVIDQFSGDVISTQTPDGRFAVRAELRDPAAFEATLRKLADELPKALRAGGDDSIAIVKPKRGERFYAVSTPDRDERVVFGVVDDVFVVARDPEQAAAMGAESPERVEGLTGAAVATADAGALAKAVIADLAGTEIQGLVGSLATRSLGNVTTSLDAETNGIRGRLRLEIK